MNTITTLPASVYTSTRYTEKTSDKFRAITTADALSTLQLQGWEVFKASASNTRQAERIPYARHQIQLTHPDIATVDGLKPIIYLQNANDGTSSFRLFAGLFRFICSNGLVVGSSFLSESVRHTGERETVTNRLQEKTWEVASEFPRIMERVERMREKEMSFEEKAAFSFMAFNLRVQKPKQYVRTVGFNYRREGDQSEDLWTFYNRAQEDVITGGFLTGNRFRRARRINSLVRSTVINRQLWDLTEVTLDGSIVERARESMKQGEERQRERFLANLMN